MASPPNRAMFTPRDVADLHTLYRSAYTAKSWRPEALVRLGTSLRRLGAIAQSAGADRVRLLYRAYVEQVAELGAPNVQLRLARQAWARARQAYDAAERERAARRLLMARR